MTDMNKYKKCFTNKKKHIRYWNRLSKVLLPDAKLSIAKDNRSNSK